MRSRTAWEVVAGETRAEPTQPRDCGDESSLHKSALELSKRLINLYLIFEHTAQHNSCTELGTFWILRAAAGLWGC